MTSHDRRLLQLTGPDTRDFLQGIVTNDVAGIDAGLVYAALLSPQGKYLADFFLVPWGDAVLVDVAEPLADGLARRLALYKLRAAVALEEADVPVARGPGTPPEAAFADPRHPDLGWRRYGGAAEDGFGEAAWAAQRVRTLVPESGIELVPDATFVLEAGLDRLHGVDFRKGCYVGQEVTARMRHKTDLRKGLARVEISGSAPIGTPIFAGEKPAGTLYTQADGQAIAYLRFDRAHDDLVAGDATLRWIDAAA